MDKKDFESLLNKYPDCVSDGKKLKAFLTDLYPDVPKAIVNTLTIMADDGIISEMQMSAESSTLVAARLQKKLEDDYGLSQKIIAECFSLIIYDSAKQTQATINAGTYEKITSFIDTQPTFALRKEVPQKLDILQPKYDPKDFEIVNGVLKKYKGSSSVVVIPDSVTSIGSEAFYFCKGLTSVTIPDSVTSIGYNAFWGCTGLTSIAIGDNVTSIGFSAFECCTGLTSVTIPNSVTSIGVSAFYGTAWYDNQPDGLVYAGKVAYKYKGTMPSNTSIVLREGTLGIVDSAFFCRTELTNITIPDSVTSIGGGAFYGTAWYNNQPDGLVYAGKVAYTYKGTMPSNTSIVLREGTLGIAGSAFNGCKGLTSVTIPNSVTSIGGSAFYGCTVLTNITVTKGNTKYHSAGNCLIETESKTLIAGCKNSIIPTDGSVTSIGRNAFWGCSGLTSVAIPDSVTSIGSYAFRGCSNLTIYCEAESKPIGWSSDWNPEHRPVVWGVKNKT